MRDGDDAFVAAGSPWFLTLFGRDSLWAARLLMPLRHRAGAVARCGRSPGGRASAPTPRPRSSPARSCTRSATPPWSSAACRLPPVYYGTVDATPLFVCTLADAWRWGADRRRGRRAAARRTPVPGVGGRAVRGSPAGCATSTCPAAGLANQGWKDSVDSVQFADGRLADPPIALCEVQGYAYEAAVRGAELLDGVRRGAGGRAGATGPPTCAERFGREFWVDTEAGGHVGDRAGRRRRARSTR